ncbi:MAG: hypothetical protein ABI831_03740 [Betaproteobacteria bacterium]
MEIQSWAGLYRFRPLFFQTIRSGTPIQRREPVKENQMLFLARSGPGRIVLHLVALVGDRCVRFHLDGIMRELRVAE